MGVPQSMYTHTTWLGLASFPGSPRARTKKRRKAGRGLGTRLQRGHDLAVSAGLCTGNCSESLVSFEHTSLHKNVETVQQLVY